MSPLASAYPNPALSAATMMLIGFVVFSTLAAWIALVFLADSKSGKRKDKPEERPDYSYLVAVASPDRAAENERSEADSGQAAGHQVTAA